MRGGMVAFKQSQYTFTHVDAGINESTYAFVSPMSTAHEGQAKENKAARVHCIRVLRGFLLFWIRQLQIQSTLCETFEVGFVPT